MGGAAGALVPAPRRAMAAGGWRWLRGLWAAGQPLFQGRALLVTNTLGCGALMAAGDGARQSWEIRARPGQKFDPRRSGLGCLEGQTLDESCQELRDKFWEFYKADWCVWPAAQLVNFLFVPAPFRVTYINGLTLGWDTYLSYLKYREPQRPVTEMSHAQHGAPASPKPQPLNTAMGSPTPWVPGGEMTCPLSAEPAWSRSQALGP
ncbi:mpv17-like protein 2 isoform X4 [Diceros bicornis minor]|uniref:mpv17-like protein 2 isoform X4 n=1 Tax=Diceros bicornis minor TaxID=77932 RepID=UPI0026EAAD41|nr:mpv17-like protein 2 isoform X4 [Diceros bicornis minor]